jgi:hypothetical protein
MALAVDVTVAMVLADAREKVRFHKEKKIRFHIKICLL